MREASDVSINPGYIFAGLAVLEALAGAALIASAWRASVPRKLAAAKPLDLPDDLPTLNVNHWEGAL